jgi:PAS domain S-box-containing protein
MVKDNTGPADVVIRAASAMDKGDSAVIATDNTGTIVYWNEPATALYGWEREEALDRNIVDVTPAQQSSAEAERIMHELVAGHTWSGSFLVRHKNGTPIIVEVTDVPVMDRGNVAGIIGISHHV